MAVGRWPLGATATGLLLRAAVLRLRSRRPLRVHAGLLDASGSPAGAWSGSRSPRWTSAGRRSPAAGRRHLGTSDAPGRLAAADVSDAAADVSDAAADASDAA